MNQETKPRRASVNESGQVSSKTTTPEPIAATIPGLPPSLWKAYHERPHGHGKCLTGEARAWCEFAAVHLARCRPREPISCLVRLDILLVGRDERRWDVENRVKVLSDLLTRMGFWLDDSQVWDLRVRRELGRAERTAVEISPLD